MGSLAYLRMAQGQLREAEGTLRQALGFAAERGAELLPAVGRVRIGMGELLYERDELDASERELTLGTELTERAGELEILVRGQVALSRARQARGDTDSALELAHKTERLTRDSGAPQAIIGAALWKARLHLMRDELQAAASQLERASGVRDVAEAADRKGNTIEILTLQALALRAKEEKTRALNIMGQALALGEPEGYVRTYVDEGPAMVELLSEVLEAQQKSRLAFDVPTHYLRKLMAVLERGATGATLPAARLPEPLSERELEVLQLIAAGKTNRQIATELFVSVGTVKTHINNVYGKLDVHSRTQALARARELDLI